MTLSVEAQRLLKERLRTPEMLVAFLTMHSLPTQAWDAESLALRLGVDASVCISMLERLVSLQLVQRVPVPLANRYLYGPGDEQTARATDELARSYEEDRLAILRSMNAGAMDRVRAAARALFGLAPGPDPTSEDKSR